MKGLNCFKKIGIRKILYYTAILFIVVIIGYIAFNFGSFVEGFNKEWDSK